MKARFVLFRRGPVFYCEHTVTGKQSSLKTRDKSEAQTFLHGKNGAIDSQPAFLRIK